MVAHIVCGGPDLWLPDALAGLVIGVDRGALELIQRSITFDVAIGDFDSVTVDEFGMIEKAISHMVKLPEEKDVTDCEAAIQYAVEQGYDVIYLYGVTGGRLDHLYAVSALMLKYAKLAVYPARGIQIYVENKKNRMFVLPIGSHTIKITDKKYISFFALERSVRALTIGGVKYPLDCYDLEVDDALCVSNEATYKQVFVSFSTGYLLVIQSSD